MSDTTTLEMLAETGNIAETLAREMKEPIFFEHEEIKAVSIIALPPGWDRHEIDSEEYLPTPRRKKASVFLNDVESFIDYVRRHGSLTDSSIWCKANYVRGDVNLTAILNDNGDDPEKAAWRDHIARFEPTFSEEWNRWTAANKKPMSQSEFAMFIEDNMGDITTADGTASGAMMLDMALQFEANQDMRFKSAIRLQNGGVQMAFVQDDDDATLAKMQMFDSFHIGVSVFWNGQPYLVRARLRYRVRDGKLTFWYELKRPDKALEDATKAMLEVVREKTGTPFFFGNPFA
ncbi:MAG: YfdQ family protein [Burkholderiales bacterium]|jgi:uncharacterized protein YfdQ (DUF2303 family)|nr:YfdQ family protein [Burkholderiales bacterium]